MPKSRGGGKADGGSAAGVPKSRGGGKADGGIDAGVPKSRGNRKADGGTAFAEDRPCRSDDDCTLTRVPPGKCCATLCEGRAVTRQRARELEQNEQRCAQRQGCPQPLCRPPESVTVAACEAGRCVTKTAGKTN